MTALLMLLSVGPGSSGEAVGKELGLSVLYVGHPQTPRQQDFVGFLKKHFSKVGKGDLDTFQQKNASGYDVIIMDYSGLVVKGNTIQTPTVPFRAGYTRPTVMVGATGALMCDHMRLRVGYL